MSNPLSQIPGYFALRTGADLASSIRGQTVVFNYEPGTLVVTESLGVPVFTSPTAAKRPAVAEAQISCGKAFLSLCGTQYSALFWSNSAVEKFLLPYFVSAGGDQAYQVLQAIATAWYHVDKDNQACALAFSYPSVPTVGPQQLWDMVQVISYQRPRAARNGKPATGAQLVATPLLEFIHNLPHPKVSPVEAVPQGSLEGTSTAPAGLDSIGAREVAEYVAGLQGQKVWVYEKDGEIQIRLSSTDEGTLLFTATSPVRVPRPKVSVQLIVPSLTEQEWSLGNGGVTDPDSAFWTDGAVEMLLLPYYASVEGQWAPWYLAVLLCKWSGMIPATVTDAAALLKQIPEAMARAVAAFVEEEILDSFAPPPAGEAYPIEEPPTIEMHESEVFAIVHLPRSEWVDEHGNPVEAFELEHRTALLTAAGQAPLVSPRRRLIPRRVTG